MMVIEEAEIPLAFSVWARGGQAPLRAQTSLFTDLLAGGPVAADLLAATCRQADLLAGGPVGRRTCRGTSAARRAAPWPPEQLGSLYRQDPALATSTGLHRAPRADPDGMENRISGCVLAAVIRKSGLR